MTIARHVHYSGRVQGVGFRYTARGLAKGYPIVGYVRNLPGGQVELWAEGDKSNVQDFLTALSHEMGGYIHEQTVVEETPCGMKGFTIRV